MRALYLDCEFNGTGGHLISIALYDPISNNNFYEVDDLWETTIKYSEDGPGLKKWVRENVIPLLGKKAVGDLQIKAYLQSYLASIEDKDVIVYADWPEDFVHLMKLLYNIPSNTNIPIKLVSSLKMELITTGDIHISKIPHNALEDAKALYLNHMEDLKK